jgi:hypothetical protein
MMANQLPEFLRWVKKSARAMNDAATRTGNGNEVNLAGVVGNDLPEQGGFTGQMRGDPSEGTARGYRQLVPAIVEDYTNDPAGGAPSAVRERRADPVRKLLAAARAPEEVPDERGPLAQSVSQQPTVQPSPTVQPPPGYDPSTTATRPRWSSELNSETEHNAALRDAEAHPEEAHGWRRYIVPMVQAAMSGGRSGDPLAALGGAGAGLAVGAADPRAANRMKYGRKLRQSDARLGQLRTERKEDLGAEQQQAQTDWLKARPGLEEKKLDAQGAQRAQSILQREIGNRLKEPRAFDPSDPYDADLSARAQAAGVHFAPGSFGDFKNPATMEIIDPSDPSGTRKTRLSYNRESGEFQPVTVDGKGVQTGYVQPVGENGMTNFQIGQLQLGGARFAETQKQNSISNDLRRAGLSIAQGQLTLAGQGLDLRKLELDQRLSEQTRSELKDANKVLADANGAQAEADDYSSKGWYKGDDGLEHRAKWAVKAETDAANKAEALRQQFYGNYGYLWGNKMTRLQFSKNHPELMDSSEGSKFHSNKEVDEMARRYGIEIVPDDSPIETAPSVGNSLPRRGAPARSNISPRSAAPAAGRYAGQRMSAANLPAAAKASGKSEADAKAYIEAQGGVIY